MPYPVGISYTWAVVGVGILLWFKKNSSVSKSLIGTTLLYGLLGINSVRIIEDLFLPHLVLIGAETFRDRWKIPRDFWWVVPVMAVLALPPIWLVHLKPWSPKKDQHALKQIPDGSLVLNTFNAFYRVYYLEGSRLKMIIGIDPSFFPDSLVDLYLHAPDQLAQDLGADFAVVTKDRSGASILSSLVSQGWRVLGQGDELVVLQRSNNRQ